MGSLQAQEMAELMTIEDGLAWHLRSNHYPPVPLAMIQPCIEAIDAALEDDWDREIQLPFDGLDRNGEPFQITWRGRDTAPAYAIIDGHHLHAWVQLDEESEDE
jgi:hypothetical protein